MTNSPSTQPIRVTPIGPLNGMSEIDSAVDAPTMDMMSRGVSRSAEMGVVMICTSLRKSFGNSGLSGRSVRRMVRTVSVVGRPSRRGNPPGMRPRAYRRSSKSMVSGKKSIPSRGFAIVAVTSTIESPCRTTTAPFACCASFPVSMVNNWSPTCFSNVLDMKCSLLLSYKGKQRKSTR